MSNRTLSYPPRNKNNPGGNDHRRGGRFNRNRYQHNAAQPGGRFKGKIKEIADDTFDNTGLNNAANFNKSLKNIANYLQLMLGNNISEAVWNMAPVKINVPPPPKGLPDPFDSTKTLPVSDFDFYLWKQEHSKASKKKDEFDNHLSKAYIVIIQQCSPALCNDLKADKTFPAVCSAQDPLALIQGLCCLYNLKVQSVMATMASHKRLYTYYQRDGVDNHTYHCEFMSFVETIETYGGLGAVGVIPMFLDKKNQRAPRQRPYC